MSDTLCVSAYSRRGIIRRRFATAILADQFFTELKASKRYQAILVACDGKTIRRYLSPQIRSMPMYGKGKVNVRLHNALANKF